jgi:hypothetical protein
VIGGALAANDFVGASADGFGQRGFAFRVPSGPVSQRYAGYACGRPDDDLGIAMLADDVSVD